MAVLLEGAAHPLSDVGLAVRGLDANVASELAEEVEKAVGRRVNVVLVEEASPPFSTRLSGTGSSLLVTIGPLWRTGGGLSWSG